MLVAPDGTWNSRIVWLIVFIVLATGLAGLFYKNVVLSLVGLGLGIAFIVFDSILNDYRLRPDNINWTEGGWGGGGGSDCGGGDCGSGGGD